VSGFESEHGKGAARHQEQPCGWPESPLSWGEEVVKKGGAGSDQGAESGSGVVEDGWGGACYSRRGKDRRGTEQEGAGVKGGEAQELPNVAAGQGLEGAKGFPAEIGPQEAAV